MGPLQGRAGQSDTVELGVKDRGEGAKAKAAVKAEKGTAKGTCKGKGPERKGEIKR